MKTEPVLPEFCREADAPALKVLVIYEDFSSGVRGKNFAERLATKLGGTCALSESLWRAELLEVPRVAAEATRVAADCDYLILSLHGDCPLPVALRHWLDAVLDGAAARGTGLIALINFAGHAGRADGGIRHYLRFLCADKGVEFFSHAGTLPGDTVARELFGGRWQQAISQSANAATSTP